MPWDAFGYIHSKETKEKISKTMRKRGVNQGTKNPMSRAIVQLTRDGSFIRKWDYIKEATKFVADTDNPTLISAVCRGAKKHGTPYTYKTAYGYKWMFLEDYINKYGAIPEAN